MRSMYFKAAEEMGQSNIIKFLIKYSVPSIISGLVSTGDNPVDDHFVAQFGAPALAALAAANPLMIIRNAVGGGPGLAPPQTPHLVVTHVDPKPSDGPPPPFETGIGRAVPGAGTGPVRLTGPTGPRPHQRCGPSGGFRRRRHPV